MNSTWKRRSYTNVLLLLLFKAVDMDLTWFCFTWVSIFCSSLISVELIHFYPWSKTCFYFYKKSEKFMLVWTRCVEINHKKYEVFGSCDSFLIMINIKQISELLPLHTHTWELTQKWVRVSIPLTYASIKSESSLKPVEVLMCIEVRLAVNKIRIKPTNLNKPQKFFFVPGLMWIVQYCNMDYNIQHLHVKAPCIRVPFHHETVFQNILLSESKTFLYINCFFFFFFFGFSIG